MYLEKKNQKACNQTTVCGGEKTYIQCSQPNITKDGDFTVETDGNKTTVSSSDYGAKLVCTCTDNQDCYRIVIKDCEATKRFIINIVLLAIGMFCLTFVSVICTYVIVKECIRNRGGR